MKFIPREDFLAELRKGTKRVVDPGDLRAIRTPRIVHIDQVVGTAAGIPKLAHGGPF
jgi:hypothetical protein